MSVIAVYVKLPKPLCGETLAQFMNAPTPSRSLALPARLRILVLEGLKLFAIAIGCLVVFAIGFFVWVKAGRINHYTLVRASFLRLN